MCQGHSSLSYSLTSTYIRAGDSVDFTEDLCFPSPPDNTVDDSGHISVPIVAVVVRAGKEKGSIES